jgi:phytoene synthase
LTDDDERLLASRFASREGRDDLAALYAFDDELGRVAPAVSQPLLGEIRLAWWREGIEELGAKPARSPALAALEPLVSRGQGESLIALVEARAAELEPFPDEPALMTFIDASQGGLMLAAAQALDPAARSEQVRDAARAYALARLPDRWRPQSWGEASEAEMASHLRGRISEALKGAEAALRDLPTAAFPAVAHATLARTSPEASALSKRLRLLWAVVRGKI